MQIRKCPICSSDDYSKVVAASQNPISLSFDTLKTVFVGLRADQIFFQYSRCNFCKLVYNREYFTELELAEMYKHMPPNLVGDDLDVVSKTHLGYAKQISREIINADSLIEIGADVGLVTSEVVRDCLIRQGVLIEPNKDVQSELFSSIGNNPNFKIVDYLSEVQNDMNFDLCIAVHVIDHLINPLEDLIKVRNLMNKGSKIFIVVHNQSSVLAKLMGRNWPPYCLQHPQIFNPATIEKLLIAAGYNNVVVKKTTNWIGLRHSLTTLATLLHLPKGIFTLFPNIPIPVKLGNIMVSANV